MPAGSTNTFNPKATPNHNLSSYPLEYECMNADDVGKKGEAETQLYMLVSLCLFAQTTAGLYVLWKMEHLQM